jgi:glycosyltransferase involved in cell wall biosynthesis
MKVVDISNAYSASGVGHRTQMMKYYLTELDCDVMDVVLDGEKRELSVDGVVRKTLMSLPSVFGSKTASWIWLGRAARGIVESRDVDIYHLTNQTLSFVARKLSPCVVTVHDIIEYIEPQSSFGGIASRYLYSGIVYADHVIAVSSYTKNSLMEYFDIPESRISVAHNGVGSEFHQIENFKSTVGYGELRRELKLGNAQPVVLYVGSEHPRKNVPVAVKAFAGLKKDYPDAVFIKVGKPGLPAGRVDLLDVLDELHIREAVRFINGMSSDRLNDVYNLADVLIFPSKFEGFGLPLLQSMAAGTPVVCSNVTSIPEVVGSAARMHSPDDVDGFAKSMKEIVENPKFAGELQEKGLERAKKFSWEESADKVKKVFEYIVAGA